MLCFNLFRQQISKFNTFDWKVDNSRVLLHKEGVLGEPLDVEDDEAGQLDQLKLLEEVVLVGLVLLLLNTVELGQYVVQRHLDQCQHFQDKSGKAPVE